MARIVGKESPGQCSSGTRVDAVGEISDRQQKADAGTDLQVRCVRLVTTGRAGGDPRIDSVLADVQRPSVIRT